MSNFSKLFLATFLALSAGAYLYLANQENQADIAFREEGRTGVNHYNATRRYPATGAAGRYPTATRAAEEGAAVGVGAGAGAAAVPSTVVLPQNPTMPYPPPSNGINQNR